MNLQNRNMNKGLAKKCLTIGAVAILSSMSVLPFTQTNNTMFDFGVSISADAATSQDCAVLAENSGNKTIKLTAGKWYSSNNGKYVLIFQNDGNLVLRRRENADSQEFIETLWSSNTAGRGTQCIFGNNGSFVIKDKSGKTIWHSATAGDKNTQLCLTDKGDISIRRISDNQSAVEVFSNPDFAVTGQSAASKTMVKNKWYSSNNDKYYLVFQEDGNLVLREKVGNKAVWSSNTAKKSGTKCYMQSDGNFIIRKDNGDAVWWTQTERNYDAYLCVTNDGEVCVKRACDRSVLWSSKQPAPTVTKPETPAVESFIWPAPGQSYISSPYGRRNGTMHRGIDIGDAGIGGKKIVASKSGTVKMVVNTCPHDYAKDYSCGCGGGYGNYVLIDHGDGTSTMYAHQRNVVVSIGQAVSQGQTIGYVGCTGHSTGNHLHFEIRINGSQDDPTGYVHAG